MKIINHFFVFLMGLSLASTILSFCLNRTLLNPDFVTAQADKSGIYTDLAQTLPKQMAGGSDTSPQTQAALERVITAQFLQTNLDSYIHNIFTSYQTGAAIPPLDLTAVIPQIEALGVKLTPQDKAELEKNLTIDPTAQNQKDQNQNQPQAPGQAPQPKPAVQQPAQPSQPNPGVSGLYRKASSSKLLLILSTLILAALVFVTAPHHRLKALAHGCISAAIWLGIYYAFFKIAPGIAEHQIKTAKDFSLAGSVSKLITLAAGGVAKLVLYGAIGCLAVGVGLWAASLFTPHLATGEAKTAKSKDGRTPLPTLFHKD